MAPSNDRGFTLIEVTIVLMVLAILTTVLVPSIGNFNRLARDVRLREDLGVICSSLKMMIDDLGASAFWGYERSYMTGYAASYGGGGSSGSYRVDQSTVIEEWCEGCDMPHTDCGECFDDCDETCLLESTPITTQTYSWQSGGGVGGGSASSFTTGRSYGGYGGAYAFPLGLLVGDGAIPASAVGLSGWTAPVGTTFTVPSYWGPGMSFQVGALGDQLIHGAPAWGYASASYGNGYGMGSGAYGFDRMFRWRGPYIADAIFPTRGATGTWSTSSLCTRPG